MPVSRLYEVLGVAPDSSTEQVRRAYIALARAHHPDRFVDADDEARAAAEATMREINEAWHVLGDVDRRRRYDEAHAPGRDPLRLLDAQAVLGEGFTLRLRYGVGMTAKSWVARRIDPDDPRTHGGTRNHRASLVVTARDLRPLRKLLPGEVQGIDVRTHPALGDRELEPLWDLHWLETLRLEGTRVTDQGVQQLPRLHSLWSLDLDATQVTDAGMAAVGRCASLVELSLTDTAVGDDGVRALLSLSRLRLLALRGTKVTDEGAAMLASLTALELLALPRGVGWGTKRMLRRAIPRLHLT